MPMSGSISPFTDCQVVLACIRVQQLEQVLTRSDEAFRVLVMMMMMITSLSQQQQQLQLQQQHFIDSQRESPRYLRKVILA